MTETKQPEKTAAKAVDEVQKKTDEALEKGYIGEVPDPEASKAHSLLTGPDAPPLVPDNVTRREV